MLGSTDLRLPLKGHRRVRTDMSEPSLSPKKKSYMQLPLRLEKLQHRSKTEEK